MTEISQIRPHTPRDLQGAQQTNIRIGSSDYTSALVRENNQLKAALTELEELNKRDSLTGLLNKKAYGMLLHSEYGKVKMGELPTLGVVRIDLDNFSWVNDIMGGHHFGDMFLTVTGDLLDKQLRGGKDYAFRVGGDEFALLLQGPFSESSFRETLGRLHESINNKVLDRTLDLLRRSNRAVLVPGGKTESEGTVALKELLHGIYDLRRDTDGAREHFISHGRGDMSIKSDLLHKIDVADLSRFEAYEQDVRVGSELNTEEMAARKTVEFQLVRFISSLFPSLTMSMAGALVIPTTELDPIAVDRKADTMVSTIKRRGGSAVDVKTL